jgi:hypothetical protein
MRAVSPECRDEVVAAEAVTPADLRAAGKIGPYMFGDDTVPMTFTRDELRLLHRALSDHAGAQMDERGETDSDIWTLRNRLSLAIDLRSAPGQTPG